MSSSKPAKPETSREQNYRKAIVLLSIVLLLSLGVEGFYVYKTRSYLREWYDRHFGETRPEDTPGYVPAPNPLLRQRSEAFSMVNPRSRDKQVVIFAGDSITETFPWAEYFADMANTRVLNRGIYGDSIQGMNERFEVTFLPELEPVVFLMVGINNITKETSCAKRTFLKEYYELLNRLLDSKIPPENIYVQSILPVRREGKSNAAVVECNKALQQYATERGMRYLDIHSRLTDEGGALDATYSLDGVHLTAEGYRVWLEMIEKYVRNGLSSA